MGDHNRGVSGSQYHGRLELTWTNKDQALLWSEDGKYRWVPPADYRVAEIRLLHDAGDVGHVGPHSRRAADNLLIRGDALNALTSLARIPEFQREYLGKVKLAYLDPPFNTQQAFEQYDDALEHSVWLTMMRDRLLQVKRLLASDGSIWVHCDDSEQAYLKVLMDEIFGRDAFVAAVVWQKRYSRDNRPAIGTVHDYILVYSPLGAAWKDARNRIVRDIGEMKQYRNPNSDPRGSWRPIPLDVQAGHATASQFYEVATPGGVVHKPSSGRAWSVTKPRMDQMIAEGKVYFGQDGRGKPNLIRYADEDTGLVPWTWWPHDEVGHNDEAKKEILTLFPSFEPFDTPKPERLMRRIIEIATNPGDRVLDPFLGSGTTAAVAHKLGRLWIGVERDEKTLTNFALSRIEKVVAGEDSGGVSEALGWGGGGGFRILDVAPSMFSESRGTVVLADWAVNGHLAEATAAQLGYEFHFNPPFCGSKGRSLLAVVDGLITSAVVELIGASLEPNERTVVCGTAVAADADAALKAVSPGSRVRRIPASILADYRLATRRFFHSREVGSPQPNLDPDGSTAGKPPAEAARS